MKTLTTVDEIADLFAKEIEEIENTCCGDHFKHEIYEKVKSVIDATCIMIDEFEDTYRYDPATLKSLRTLFQNKSNKIILKSYCLNRARTWPQGHQGDYKTLETIYRNTPLSSGIGYYLDLYGLNHPLSIAVRNRIQILQNILSEELLSRMKPNIMNIGCGSCRELVAIAPDISRAKAKITCIDDDSDALNFALNRISYTSAKQNVTFRKYNALRMFDHESNVEEFGMQDIIYSVGLYDYLPDDFLISLLSSLYKLLRENGKLILAFKDARYYNPSFNHWILAWDGFKRRKESDFLRTLNDAMMPISNIKSFKDETSVINFYLINKSVTN